MALVAIVGRPNVGKSTFFNRITETRQAIVDDQPGVTRDRIYGHAEWNGRTFAMTDTGGYVHGSDDRFEAAIREQVHLAIDEADVIVLVVDVTTDATDLDNEVAAILRKSKKPVLVAVNKADNEMRRYEASSFYSLGLGEIYPISSINGAGTGDLLDAVVAALPEEPEADEDDDRPRIAIIGRPNTGKSSLTNALLGHERMIVTEVSGTTRDAVDAVVKWHGQEVVLVDTAGLRRRARVKENIEFYSTLRTQRAINDCDVAILMLDATQGLEAQDIRVLKEAENQKKGLVICVNKWDLVENKESNTPRDYTDAIFARIKMLDYVPVLFISALTKQRVHRVLEKALEVYESRGKRIPTAALNDVVLQAVSAHHPPVHRNRPVKIKYATQVRTEPPVMAIFCNQPKGVQDSYRRYLDRQIREAFGFEGVPLTLSFRKK